MRAGVSRARQGRAGQAWGSGQVRVGQGRHSRQRQAWGQSHSRQSTQGTLRAGRAGSCRPFFLAFSLSWMRSSMSCWSSCSRFKNIFRPFSSMMPKLPAGFARTNLPPVYQTLVNVHTVDVVDIPIRNISCSDECDVSLDDTDNFALLIDLHPQPLANNIFSPYLHHMTMEDLFCTHLHQNMEVGERVRVVGTTPTGKVGR